MARSKSADEPCPECGSSETVVSPSNQQFRCTDCGVVLRNVEVARERNRE